MISGHKILNKINPSFNAMSSRIQFLLEQVRAQVRRREETDRKVSYAWLIFLILWAIVVLALIAVIFAFPALLPIIYGVAILVQIPYLILLYMLISRRNRHFARQQRLFEYTLEFLREASKARNVNPEARLMSVERELREARDEEGEKNAVIWVILTLFTGILGLYVYYFLMKDFPKHERREDRILEDVNAALTSMGAMPLPKREEAIPNRSFALYFVLSLVTVGIFAIYWLYTLIRDPNIHFREQARIEDDLIRRIEVLAS
jgi:hypothetical protein